MDHNTTPTTPPPAPSITSNDPINRAPTRQMTVDVPSIDPSERPQPVKHISAPTTAYQSPLRHHHRAASTHREVKETLNARSQYSNSEDDGAAQHRINQYIIKQEIGRGSFGAVHHAVDQFGQEYAVKEFSKSRLRKRAQSNLLRRPNQLRRPGFAARHGFNSPLHRHSPSGTLSDVGGKNNSLDLIKEEIAIMKKLNHPNLVSLIEVLDDPDEDSLYMVLEMCKKGVVMKVGLNEDADPYEDEQIRCWFRDMILGIEYLHAQGIIHRDLKPDNCLITEDDVLKIVDFGVSEMFDKGTDMSTDKNAGSPAFMPPELCVAKHGHVSGRAADIWSMGVTLYCLRFGRIPFHREGIFELYDAIRTETPFLGSDEDTAFGDLIRRLLEKDPEQRIKMEELREHPWVTRDGTDPLLPREENISTPIEATDEEVNTAITHNMGHLLVVMKAVKRFKTLLLRRHPEFMEGIFGRASRIVAPPQSIRPSFTVRKAHSTESAHRPGPVEGAFASEGIHRDPLLPTSPLKINHTTVPTSVAAESPMESPATPRSGRGSPAQLLKPEDAALRSPATMSPEATTPIPTSTPTSIPPVTTPPATSAPSTHSSKASTPTRGHRGHAHDPLEDRLYLSIGPGPSFSNSEISEEPSTILDESNQVVCESPGAVDINVFETAYQDEVCRILESQRSPTIYLTRRVERSRGAKALASAGTRSGGALEGVASGALAGLLKKRGEGGLRGGLAKLAEEALARGAAAGPAKDSGGPGNAKSPDHSENIKESEEKEQT